MHNFRLRLFATCESKWRSTATKLNASRCFNFIEILFGVFVMTVVVVAFIILRLSILLFVSFRLSLFLHFFVRICLYVGVLHENALYTV